LGQVRFTAGWATPLTGVRLGTSGPGGRVVTVTPTSSTPGPQQGSVQVGVKGSTQPAQTLSYNVLPPQDKQSGPPMTLRPITIAGVKAGESRAINVSSYAVSGLPHPQYRVLSCARHGGTNATCKTSGSSVTVTPASSAHGVATFTLAVTDDPAEKSRTVQALLSVSVLGSPAAPTSVTADANRTDGGQVNVSWATPAYDGGATIDYYVVEWAGGPAPKHCASSPCLVTGLTNGKAYTFRVAAHNGAGFTSTFSSSNSATPDAKPDQVSGVSITKVGDHSLTVAWSPATGTGSAVTHYRVTIVNKGGGTAPAPAVLGKVTSYPVSGLTNDDVYSFTIAAQNADGWGLPSASVDGQSAGKPSPLTAPDVPAEQPTVPTDDTTVAITWKAETDPNGPPTKSYTVYRRTGTSGTGKTMCTRSANEELTCNDQVANDGTTYQYGVSATNGAGIESDVTDWTTFKAIGMPDQVSGVQAFDGSGPGNTAPGLDGKINVSFTVPKSHGAAITEMQYQLNGGGWTDFPGSAWAEGASETETIGGLTNGTKYAVAVRAGNGTYFGPASAASNTVTPYGNPFAPKVSVTNADKNNVYYYWSDTENGRPITYYIQYDGKGGYVPSGSGASGQKGPIDVGYNYTYSISAYVKDSAGSPQSETVSASGTTASISAPTNLACTVSGKAANCTWNSAGSEISYDVKWGDGTTSSGVTGTQATHTYGGYGKFTVEVDSVDTKNASNTNRPGTTAPVEIAHPQFQVAKNTSGSCNTTKYPGCVPLEVRLVGFAQGGTATCFAGGVDAPNWGPYTLTARADGTSAWVTGLFDSENVMLPGTYDIGTDDGGVTCQ
jgi:hypothetical protein